MAVSGMESMPLFGDLGDEEYKQATSLLSSPSSSTTSGQTPAPFSAPGFLPAGTAPTTLDGTSMGWATTSTDVFPTFDTAPMLPQSWDFAPQLQPQMRHPDSPPHESIAGVAPSSLYTQPAMQGDRYPQAALPTEALAVLTPAQQAKLKSIAMPDHVHQFPSPKSASSPGSVGLPNEARNSSSPDAPEPPRRYSRKRKSSAEIEEEEDEGEDVDGSSPQPAKKTTHNMIEKRYRTNLNDKIAALRDSVPSLRIMSKTAKGEDVTEDKEALSGLAPAHKLNKATVLTKATEYIRHLEKRCTRLSDENKAMQQRITAFERLFMAGAMTGSISTVSQPATTASPYTQRNGASANNSVATTQPGASAGMIPVPDDMRRIVAQQMATSRPYPVPQQSYPQQATIVRQQQIQQARQMQAANRWTNAGPYMGKLMVGSLAGLMILEAVRENESSNERTEGRGLFAVPLEFLHTVISSSHVSIAGYVLPAAKVINSIRLFVLVGLLLWFFMPSLFVQKPRRKVRMAAGPVEAAPSLASPIHLRRQAWLTAVQTVWVPRHNFFLEAAALMLKTVKLSLRTTIGVQGYQWLTGLTEEQETARVKAWTIALDAQLAGGDVEINKSRLTLTLLASGTLPDTPQRLMLKALHTRVLLSQATRDSLFSPLTRIFATEISKSKWTNAKLLDRMITQMRGGSKQKSEDTLPEHLSFLLQKDCQEVLSSEIVQRAYNLAWNQPTTQGVRKPIDGMDSVVDDMAVRSPMDAVAAWYSCTVLHEVLTRSLAEDDLTESEHQDMLKADLVLALKVAPIGSNAQIRAQVARAILIDDGRAASITAGLLALQVSEKGNKSEQASSVPDADVRLALHSAMAIARLRNDSSATHLPSDTVALVNRIVSSLSQESMSLLGCTAAYRLMDTLQANAAASEACALALERLAGTLRIWLGSAVGERYGLEDEVRRAMISKCLAVTKRVVGMSSKSDSGYGSFSDAEDEREDQSLPSTP